jgi:hypothetical protein
MVRGTATTKVVDGLPPEYVAAAQRYMGDEAGDAWVANVNNMSPKAARIAIRPEWVAILDFETRWPSAIEKRMAGAAATG